MPKPKNLIDKADLPPPYEADECRHLMAWARRADVQKALDGIDLLFHIPNGERRDIGSAIKLKEMGVKPSIPDYMLPVATGNFHGLFLEMKRIGEKPTPGQKLVHAALRAQGYAVVTCEGAEKAKITLMNYLLRGQA